MMKNSFPEDARETCARIHLALASDQIQSALPVADTPCLVEELLDAHLRSVDCYLREQVEPTVAWFS